MSVHCDGAADAEDCVLEEELDCEEADEDEDPKDETVRDALEVIDEGEV